MEEIVLKAESRNVIGKQVRALRRAGKLPAVIYGRGAEPITISLDAHESAMILPKLTQSRLVTISINNAPHWVLVREKQRHPVTGHLLHVDFQEVSRTEKLRTMVMIELVGEAPAIKTYNGILVAHQEELEVECLPQHLPERVVVDLSVLKEIGDAIYVRDIVLSDKVEVLSNLEEMVAVITAPAAEEEVEGAAEGEEPEVIERGKKEEEDF